MQHDITVRHMDLPFPDDLTPLVLPGRPEESYLFVGLSLLLPYLEPYLIRTMKIARKQIDDPVLVEALERFNAQEGQHFRQHHRFNEVVRRSGFPGLAPLEAQLSDDYRRFSETKSLRFNLAYAEGFEALTTATARWSFEEGVLDSLHPAARDLFSWHLVEEFEHREVAFDVYDHVCGGYLYRLAVGTFAQWHMSRFIARAAAYMLGADPGAREANGGDAGRRARTRDSLRRAARGLLPKVLATYTPWYTPHRIDMPEAVAALGRRYSKLATRTR
jgi:predicted metal-dependent hydrolase